MSVGRIAVESQLNLLECLHTPRVPQGDPGCHAPIVVDCFPGDKGTLLGTASDHWDVHECWYDSKPVHRIARNYNWYIVGLLAHTEGYPE